MMALRKMNGTVGNAGRMNQNQRYEVRVDFTGYECLMAFRINGMKSVWTSPGHEPGRVRRKTVPTEDDQFERDDRHG